jgi:hypothetical protein
MLIIFAGKLAILEVMHRFTTIARAFAHYDCRQPSAPALAYAQSLVAHASVILALDPMQGISRSSLTDIERSGCPTSRPSQA